MLVNLLLRYSSLEFIADDRRMDVLVLIFPRFVETLEYRPCTRI